MSEQAVFTHQQAGGRTVVSASGEIDLANVAEFQGILLRAKEAGLPVVLDISKVSYCDSRTLNALARFEAGIREMGGRVALVVPTGGAGHRILQIAGLASRFERFETLEAALQSRTI